MKINLKEIRTNNIYLYNFKGFLCSGNLVIFFIIFTSFQNNLML